jgi:hypothetical protein
MERTRRAQVDISRRRTLLAIASLPAIPSLAFACECERKPTLEVAADRASSIVIANLRSGGGWLTGGPGQPALAVEPYRWTVVKSWKGRLRPGDLLETTSGPGDCVVPNLPAGEWLLFFDGPGPHKLSVCSRQIQFGKAAEEIAFLDKRYGTPK